MDPYPHHFENLENKNPDPDQNLSHNTVTQHSKRTEGERGGGLKVQEVAFLESLLASTIVKGKIEKHRECISKKNRIM